MASTIEAASAFWRRFWTLLDAWPARPRHPPSERPPFPPGQESANIQPVKKKAFRELSPRGKLVAVLAMGLSLVIVGAAERDLQARPASEIRGRKVFWSVACTNALGARAHLRWGRRAG